MTRDASVSTTPQEDLDQLLGAFFRAEMPDPWPGPPQSFSRLPPLVVAALPGSERPEPDGEDERATALTEVLAEGPLPPALVLPLPPAFPARPRVASGAGGSRLALALAGLFLLAGVWSLGGLVVPDAGSTYPINPGPGSAQPPELPIPFPGTSPEPDPEGHVRSSISLEQGADGRTGLRIDVREELAPPR